jgi:rare lipoprotein A (peptidoglycan hydrolase)
MLDRLRGLLREMEAAVEEATELARQASLEQEAQEALRAIEAQEAAVVGAAARMGTWDLIGYRDDQNPLLALLGPTGGRTCETPAGLAPTGEVFEGYASWYGWEFGGQPTATGAIFDPRLFTAANRWLPFGTFLRVTHEGRCAIVLVNDRGPYGRLERVIDLSEAAAKYLGVGVSWVRAEILVPA